MPVEKLPSGKWRAVVHLAGVRRRGEARDLRRDAVDDASTLQRQLADELGPVRRRKARPVVTVGELLDRHIALAEYAPTTADEMERARKRVPADFAAMLVADVTTADVDALYGRLSAEGIAVGGVRRVHELFGPAFRRAVRWDWCRYNPVAEARPPSFVKGKASAPSLADMGRFLAAIDDPQFAAYVRLSATVGARRGELLGLRWGDLDLRAGSVAIVRSVTWTKKAGVVVKAPKTLAGVRTVAMDATTVAALQRWKAQAGSAHLAVVAPESYVFGRLDRPRRPDWATQRWVRFCDQLEDAEKAQAAKEGRKPDYWMRGVRLHDLRHYSASRLVGAGVDPVTVAGRLGHADPRTTMKIYAHFLPERDREAADVMARELG